MSRRRKPVVGVELDPIFTIQHRTTTTPLPKRYVFRDSSVRIDLPMEFNGRLLATPEGRWALEQTMIDGLSRRIRETIMSLELLP